MNLTDALRQVSVVGAAGKMGSGIALLLLQEMARQEAELTGQVGHGRYCLNLIDTQEEGLFALRRHLRTQMTKYAEKQIHLLRQYYAGHPLLVSNEEIIHTFVQGACELIRLDHSLEWTRDSTLVFEAIVEDVDIKVSLFKQLKQLSRTQTLYLSNTSSIPISVLNEQAGLEGRLIGFHFYNPPPVQALVELVFSSQTDPQIESVVLELAKRLRKQVVKPRDVAGFIGNGYFMREIVFACQQVRNLAKEMPLPEAIYLVNRVTQDFLLRPMGIFQLIDYVGIDVCSKIAHIMTKYLSPQIFLDDLVEQMVRLGVKGGQHANGSQKDGFLQYDGQRIKGVYHPEEHRYHSIYSEGWINEVTQKIGVKPSEELTWKSLQGSSERETQLSYYFKNLFASQTLGATLAKSFLQRSRAIALDLVKDGAAVDSEDVNKVLKQGFFHLYGPVNSYERGD